MAILNADHLIEQALKLVAPPSPGAPRQVDLRRAISAAYYAVFHAILAYAADEFVGSTARNTNRYALVYRSIDHHRLRQLCEDLAKSSLPARYLVHAPSNGFGDNIAAFAATFVELQEKRHAADYDPTVRFRTADARLVIRTARAALRRFRRASAPRRKAFLTLLAFPPRR